MLSIQLLASPLNYSDGQTDNGEVYGPLISRCFFFYNSDV